MRVLDVLRLMLLGALSGGMVLLPAFADEPPLPEGGGQIGVGGSGGLPDVPEVTEEEGVATEEEFNPTITCTVEPGQSIEDVIDCLVDEIMDPPPVCDPVPTGQGGGSGGGPQIVNWFGNTGGEECVGPYDRSDFDVTALASPYWGVDITRVDGEPMVRLLFRENSAGIQTTQIRVDNSQRVGFIGVVTEVPAGTGSVFVKVNDAEVEVPTEGQSALGVTFALVNEIRIAGFDARIYGDHIMIEQLSPDPEAGIRRLQFRSTDPGIVTSELALQPPSGSEPGPR